MGGEQAKWRDWQTDVPPYARGLSKCGDLLEVIAVMPRGKTLIKSTIGEEVEESKRLVKANHNFITENRRINATNYSIKT